MTGKVSIHAPLKGATNVNHIAIYCVYVSIHAPLKGATRECDMYVDTYVKVSIHAPLKGATGRGAMGGAALSRFNSRTPKGCDVP